jgi:hypothetical protein
MRPETRGYEDQSGAELGFAIVGRLPEAFRHPRLGYVDALAMYRRL